MRRFFLAFVLVMLCSGSLYAQRRMPGMRTGEPGAWIAGGVGLFTGNGVNDGGTSSSWDFGNSTNFQYKASLERAIQNQSSFGIAGSYVRVPFTYSSSTVLPPGGGAGCSQCDAHLDMITLTATFHAGGGLGFHQVIEAHGGAVAYRSLKRDSDGAVLAPSGGNIDPIFSFGYGFGYGLSETTQINLVQDYGIALHEKSGLSNNVSNTNTVRTLRLAARLGFGSRSTRR